MFGQFLVLALQGVVLHAEPILEVRKHLGICLGCFAACASGFAGAILPFLLPKLGNALDQFESLRLSLKRRPQVILQPALKQGVAVGVAPPPLVCGVCVVASSRVSAALFEQEPVREPSQEPTHEVRVVPARLVTEVDRCHNVVRQRLELEPKAQEVEKGLLKTRSLNWLFFHGTRFLRERYHANEAQRKIERQIPMTITFNAKTYQCEYVEFKANDDGEVVVTLIGDFPTPEKMTSEEVAAIVNDPQFFDLLRAGYQNAPFGTPLWSAFEAMRRDGGEVVLCFEQPKVSEAA